MTRNVSIPKVEPLIAAIFRPRTALIAGAAALFAIFFFLFYLTNLFDGPGHQRYVATLHELKDVAAALDRDLYDACRGALPNFDPLVARPARLRALEDDLGDLPGHIVNTETLLEARGTLDNALAAKLGRIDDFKTRVAVLQTALDFAPVVRENAAQSPPALRLLQDLLLYHGAPSPGRRAALEEGIAYFLPPSAPGEAAAPPDTPERAAAAYAASVLQRRDSVEQILAGAVGPDIAAAADRLSAEYHRETAQVIRRAGIYRMILFVLAVLPLLILAFYAYGRMQRTIDTIDEHVEERAQAVVARELSRDRAEREKAIESVHFQEERFRALTSRSFEMIGLLSKEGNFIFVSPAATRIFALQESELIGKSVFEGVHPDDLVALQDYIQRTHQELQFNKTLEYRVIDANGEWHTVETHATNGFSNPAVKAIVLNTRDLTPFLAEGKKA